MDRDRFIEQEAADTAPRTHRDDSIFPAPPVAGAPDRNRDAAGDALEPSDQDVLVRSAPADTMPSQALNDPRELTPDQMQRISTDTTAAPLDLDAPAGAMDAQPMTTVAGEEQRATNMAGRPLHTITTQTSGYGRFGNEIFSRIREGMKVVDAAGEDLGKVDYVSMGDPEAVTTEGQEMQETGGIVGDLGRALVGDRGEPNVPEPFRSRLVRTGYIRVDGKGWIDTDRYVPATAIDSVEGDVIRLAVTKDQIPTDAG